MERERAAIDPFNDFPAYSEPEPAGEMATTNKRSSYDVAPADDMATTNNRSGYDVAPIDESSPTIDRQNPGPQAYNEPLPDMDEVPTTHYDRGEGDGFDFGPAHDRLDMERPTSSSDPSSSNVVVEILLGVVIGGVILGVFLWFLTR